MLCLWAGKGVQDRMCALAGAVWRRVGVPLVADSWSKILSSGLLSLLQPQSFRQSAMKCWSAPWHSALTFLLCSWKLMNKEEFYHVGEPQR